MKPFNDLSDAEKATLIKGPFGRELLVAIQPCVAPLHWTSRPGTILSSNGSAFVVKTASGLFGITAKHVYDAYKEQADQDPNVVCWLYNFRLDLRPRLISRGDQLDLVTFEIRSSELDRLDRRTVPWPPSIPRVNQSVLIAGFPGTGKRFTGPGTTTFGLFHALTGVDSVSESDISMVRPPDDEVADVVGKGLPPRAFDMGGMSGGPVLAVLENAGIVS